MNIVCIGAHPDDGEFYAGGTLVKWAQAGHRVLVVSMTNGDVGHQSEVGPQLAQRRREETQEAARRGGYHALMCECHDGELTPTLERRKDLVRLLRRQQADIVLSHRPCDYHPDHRYAAQLVQDAAFMVTVPQYCPEVPPLATNPLFLYMMDHFKRPLPFQADIAVRVDDVMDTKWRLLDAMSSQVYEWLPWLDKRLDEVPPPGPARLEWLKAYWADFLQQPAHSAREALVRRYGPERGTGAEFAELFEVCQYGQQPAPGALETLVPF